MVESGFIYILKINGKKTFYIGSTINLERRLSEHKRGKVASTKPYLPLELVFKQKCSSYAQARALELKLKKFKRKDYLEQIIQDGIIKSLLPS